MLLSSAYLTKRCPLASNSRSSSSSIRLLSNGPVTVTYRRRQERSRPGVRVSEDSVAQVDALCTTNTDQECLSLFEERVRSPPHLSSARTSRRRTHTGCFPGLLPASYF